MKLRKMGQAALAAVATAGFLLGMTSCSNDHTVGYVYVTGTQYNQIGAYREDNNQGELRAIEGQPFGSAGSNPIRAIIPGNSHFMYVLNAGTPTVDSSGNLSYSGSNISVFSIGGYGQLSFQHSYASQGVGPIRLAVDASGTHMFVLDQYAPLNTSGTVPATGGSQSAQTPCQASDGSFKPVGDITAFNIDTSTGRLTLITNTQQEGLTYFPVGCAPVDFHVAGSYVYTMDAGSTTNNDIQTVYVYAASSTNGQLTQTQNAPIPTGATSVSTISSDSSGKYIYLLDAGADFIRPYTIGTAGALTAINSGPTDNGQFSAAGNPQQLISVSGSPNTFVYVVNAGPAGGTTASTSDITGYVLNLNTGHLDQAAVDSPYGLNTVSDAVCIFEDPSNQYIYTAGANDNTIAGKKINPQTGTLRDLNAATSFATVGTPSWCLGTTSSR